MGGNAPFPPLTGRDWVGIGTATGLTGASQAGGGAGIANPAQGAFGSPSDFQGSTKKDAKPQTVFSLAKQYPGAVFWRVRGLRTGPGLARR